MSKIYNEPGKAKKQCPNCSVYVHARSLACPNCQHVFRESKLFVKEKSDKIQKEPVDKKEPTVYNEAGKGRKLCSNCNIYVAARLAVCPKCNQTIVKQEKMDREIKDKPVAKTRPVLEQDVNKKYVGKLIFAPAGLPPFAPEQDIEDWCSKVFIDGLKNDITYSNQALWYWYQRFNNDAESKNRIWEWSKREGFDKMQEHSKEPVPSTEETETDSF